MDIWSLPWLPPVIFAVVILLGFSLGYLNGWKTSTFFFGWNILGLIVSFTTFSLVYSGFLEFVSNKDIDGIDIQHFLTINKENAKAVFAIVYLIFVLLISNIVAFILYWSIPPFRKFLRKDIKINKKNGFSTKGVRFVGAGIGTISAVPLAAFATSAATITTVESNAFTKINSRLVKGLTLNQYGNPNQFLQDIRAYILILQDKDLTKTISGVFGSDTQNMPQSLTKEQKSTLEKALNSKVFITTISDQKMAKQLAGDIDLSNIDFTTTPQPLNDSIKPDIRIENREKLAEAIVKGIVPNTKNKNANNEEVYKYLKTLLGW